MKRIIIVHDWMANPEAAWYPFLKEKLNPKYYEAIIPTMPDDVAASPAAWLACLSDVVGTPSEDVTLIGHGVGGATVLRYLEVPEHRVGQALMVAGGLTSGGRAEIEAFYQPPFQYEMIRQNAKQLLGFYSDDDPVLPPTPFHHADLFFKELRGDVKLLPGHDHFTMLEFKELWVSILEFHKPPQFARKK